MEGTHSINYGALDSGLSGPGSRPGQGHRVVLGQDTLPVPLSTQVYKANCWWNLTNWGGGGSDLPVMD